MGNTKDLVTEVNVVSTSFLKTSDTIQSCTASLSSSACMLVNLVERIEIKAKELEDKEERLNHMEEELEKRTRELEKKENAMKKKANLLLELEGKWNETQMRMKENSLKLPHLITLSVGGQRFVVPKSTLTQHKGSYFDTMLTTDHPQQINGEFYIDYSPKHFQIVLDFLRNGTVEPFECNEEDLRRYFQFFWLPDPFPPVSFGASPSSTHTAPEAPKPDPELKQEDKPDMKDEIPPIPEHKLFDGGNLVNPLLQAPLKVWLPNSTFSLLFKGTRDGFAAKKFHEHCDHKGATLTVIQSKDGHLFGGYSSIPFSASLYATSTTNPTETFLFTLSNPHKIPPTMYKHLQGTPGVNSSPSTCAIFGEKVTLWGKVKHDIFLGNNANKSPFFINFPQCYEDTTGKGDCTFTGHSSFTASDVEVYLVNKL